MTWLQILLPFVPFDVLATFKCVGLYVILKAISMDFYRLLSREALTVGMSDLRV